MKQFYKHLLIPIIIVMCYGAKAQAPVKENAAADVDGNLTAYNIEMPSLLNTSSFKAMQALSAEAAIGTIASYTIETIPPAAMGKIFLCTEAGCTPVTTGQELTVEEIGKLSFQPNPTYTGDVLFYYHATDTYNQISNTVSYTIPLVSENFGSLPVSLVSFSGNINNRLVQLTWQVTQEMNSSYYEVQRSVDGTNFEPVATVTAKKIANGTSVYSATDDLFFFQQTKAYYRLKMADTDGKSKYSALIQVRPNEETKTITVRAWPNPFMNQLNTEYYSENSSAVKINFLDINGRTVAATTVQVRKGQNNFAITEVQKLQRGTYIMQFIDNDKVKTVKIVKQ